MSFRRHWLRRICRTFWSATPRSRRTATWQHLEALEDRQYLSAVVSLMGDGHTLSIVGDASDNRISIVADARGVQVTCDRDSPLMFAYEGSDSPGWGIDSPGWGIHAIQVDLGSGNDTLNFDGQLPPGPCRLVIDAGDGVDSVGVTYKTDASARSTSLPSFDLEVRLGGGNDHYSSDIQLPPGPCRVLVDGGFGDDDIRMIYGFNPQPEPPGDLPPGPCNVLVVAGDGSDTVSVNSGGGGGAGFVMNIAASLGAGDDSFLGDIQLPPGPCNVMVDGGIGNDSIRMISGFNSQLNALPPGPCNVLVDAGDGNDVVGFTLADGAAQHSSGHGGGTGFVMNVTASLGAGADSFVGDVQLPPGPCNVMVDGGDGNDVVQLNAQLDHDTGGLNFTTSLGLGNDQFQGNLLYSPGSFTPPDRYLPPGPCRWAVMGDGGVDSIYALIGLLSNATPASDVQAPTTVLFDGGDGADVVRSTVRNVNLNGATSIDLLGGAGNDIVIQSLDNVTVNAGLNFNSSGGLGDDVLTLGALPESRSATSFTPALFVNSRTQINVNGDAGNDRVFGLLIPCIKPSASLDMVFSGGDGNDLFTLLLGLEPMPQDQRGEADGPINLAALGGAGDDQLNFTVQNLGNSTSPLSLRLEGGAGNDTATVTPGIDASGWTN